MAPHSVSVMDPIAVNYAPLSEKPTASVASAVRQEARAGSFGKTTATMVKGAKGDARIIAVVFGGFITLIFALVALVRWIQDDDPYIGLIMTVFVGLLSYGLYRIGGLVGRRTWRRSVQLITFGRANGFEVQPRSKPRKLPGAIFGLGSGQPFISDWVSWNQDRVHCEAAVRHWANTGGTHADTHMVRFLAVHLETEIPRLSFSCGRSLPASADMHLGPDLLADEPDRPRRHRPKLVCGPSGRERARAFFTDELIDLLTDDDYPANAEVNDGWFFAYYRDRDMIDEDLWQHTFTTAAMVVRNAAALPDQQPGPAL